MKDQLLANLGPGAPQGFIDSVNGVFELSENLKSHVASVRENRNLSPAGRIEETKRFLTSGDFRARYNRIQSSIKTAGDHAQAQLASMRPKDADRSDSFAERQRKETREYMLTLPAHERDHLARTNDAAREAVVLAPPLLKSRLVSEQAFKDAEESEIERQHGPKLAENKKLREQIGVVQSALDIAKVDMATVSELPDGEFAKAIS